MKPKVLCTVCARSGSKGLPGKNIKLLEGKPLISYTLKCARSCELIDKVIISTDSKEIKSVAEDMNFKVPFLRPLHLASDTSPKIDSILHATEYAEKSENFYPEFIVDLDVGVPLRTSEDIINCVKILIDNPQFDCAVTVYESERNPYFNMVEFSGSQIKLVKKSGKGILSRQEAPEVFSVSPSVFVWRRNSLSIKHLYHGKWGAYKIPRHRAIDIDNKFDFDLVNWLMQSEKNH